MTEAFTRLPSPRSREAWAITSWKPVNHEEVRRMKDAASKIGVELYNTGFKGGGIFEPAPGSVSRKGQEYFAASGAKAIMLGHTKGSSEANALVHYPTKPEREVKDTNFFAYQTFAGDYLKQIWDKDAHGVNPLPGIIGHTQLEDGRHVVAVRFRRDYEPLGFTSPETGIHLMDTSRLSPDESRQLVRVIDAIHVPSSDFREWVRNSDVPLPRKSWLHPDNPGYAFRGREWWISPDGKDDRLMELHGKLDQTIGLYSDIDPDFDVHGAMESMIRENIVLYPDKDGSVLRPELAAEGVVVHGALYPDNVHMNRTQEGLSFTVSGGDRAQGYGLRGQAIDWLVTSAAASPEIQEAMIDEFFTLHESDRDRRSLAMHVLYRSIMETEWLNTHGFAREAKNLSRLTFDILKGNGVWEGLNTPVAVR